MKFSGILSSFTALLIASAATLPAAPDTSAAGKIPPIQAVKNHMWKCLRMGSFEMTGEFRTDKKSYPIMLHTNGNEMIYTFLKEPLQIRVFISPTQASLQKRASGNDAWVEVTGSARQQRVLDTDVTYEDLSLDFMRWDAVTPYGTDTLVGISTWVFEATPPGTSQFSRVRYWLTQGQSAFMKLEGYNAQGQVLKKMEVTAISRIKNMVVFKELVISSIRPGSTSVSSSRTRISIRNTKVLRYPDES